MGTLLIGILGQIASVIAGGIGGAVSMVTGLLKDGFSTVLQYNQEGVALARQMGLNAREAQAYTTVLISRAKELGKEYGIAAEQVLELQKNLSESTGKALMLNNEEAERMLQINKLIGSSISNQFTTQMMNNMGAQLSTVQGAVSKAYATAAKRGLNAQKFSEKVASNLAMANKLSFRDGVNGIIRMTALSEKLGFNLQSVESAANKFMELDSAISTSAQLQMLGGAAGAYGSNPLTMAYEANYDPEAFTKRMTDTLGGYATFDKNLGMATVNGMNRDFVKNIAQAMGISFEEAMSIAKKQAEVKYKESAYGGVLSNFSTEQRDFILNKSYVNTENGHLMMNDVNGKQIDISKGGLTQELLEELQKFDNMTDRDIMEKQAKSLTSIEELISGYKTSFFATIAEGINGNVTTIKTIIEDIGTQFVDNIAPQIAEIAQKILGWIHVHLPKITETIETVGSALGNILSFVAENLGQIVTILGGLWLGSKAIKAGRWASRLYRSSGGGSAARAVRGSTPAATRRVTTPTTTSSPAASTTSSTSYKDYINGKINASQTNAGLNAAKQAPVAKTVITTGNAAQAKTAQNGIWNSIKNFDKYINKGAKSLTNAAEKVSGAFSPIGNAIRGFGSKTSSVAKSALNFGKNIGGAATAGILSLGISGVDVKDIKEEIKNLKESYENGTIAEQEYKEKLKELQNKKNESMGSGLGSAVGGAAGSLLDEFLGPFGTILGAAIGDFLGGIAGQAWNTISNAVSDFWTGTIRDFVQENLGEVGVEMVDAVGSFFDGLTDGYGHMLESTFDLLGGVLGGLWAYLKTLFSDIGGGIIKIFHGDLTGFWDMFKAPIHALIEMVKEMGKGLWNSIINIGEAVISLFKDGVWEFIKHASSGLGKWVDLLNFGGAHAKGGIIGGTSFSGDRVLTRVNSGEMILNRDQQNSLFNFIDKGINSVLTNQNDVKARPVGEKEYIYIPNNQNNGSNVTEITVKDINVKFDGTIRLDGGNSFKNVDINQLLNDTAFVSSLKDLIKQSINNDINNGRLMNDNSTRRGLPAQTTIWGRK